MTPQFGIRTLYHRVPVRLKARAYLALCRPFTLLAPILGTLVALSLSVSAGRTTWAWIGDHWLLVAHGASTLLAVHVGSNFVNQATDEAEDRVNKQERPIPMGIVTRDEALVLGHTLWFIAILRAATLNMAFGVLVMLLVVLSMAYSEPPLRLKRIPWANNVTIALARGLLGIVAAWTITSPWTAPEPWGAGMVLFLFLVGATTAKDYGDAPGDAANGVRTLVVHYGAKKAGLVSVVWVLTPILTLQLVPHLGVRVPWIMWIVVVVSVCLLAVALFSERGTRANRLTEGTIVWFLNYIALFVLMTALGADGLGILLHSL